MNNGFVIEGGPGLWELDKIVSEEFHLEHRYAEVDSFGHFVFPEAQEKDWDGGDQSISWAGLLHGIAYYR